jgi:hypothetical protein
MSMFLISKQSKKWVLPDALSLPKLLPNIIERPIAMQIHKQKLLRSSVVLQTIVKRRSRCYGQPSFSTGHISSLESGNIESELVSLDSLL